MVVAAAAVVAGAEDVAVVEADVEVRAQFTASNDPNTN
jgi:hypothetical protein